MNCEYTARIAIGVVTDSEELRAAIEQFRDYVQNETLAVELVFSAIAGVEPETLELAGHSLTLYVRVA
jgi:isoleucyl-tRNA synthetase